MTQVEFMPEATTTARISRPVRHGDTSRLFATTSSSALGRQIDRPPLIIMPPKRHETMRFALFYVAERQVRKDSSPG